MPITIELDNNLEKMFREINIILYLIQKYQLTIETK